MQLEAMQHAAGGYATCHNRCSTIQCTATYRATPSAFTHPQASRLHSSLDTNIFSRKISMSTTTTIDTIAYGPSKLARIFNTQNTLSRLLPQTLRPMLNVLLVVQVSIM